MTATTPRTIRKTRERLKFFGLTTSPVQQRWIGFLSIALYAGVAFLLSDWLLRKYTNGDLLYYRLFFDVASKISLERIPSFQNGLTGSYEPMFGLIFWVASRIISHDALVNSLNVILIVALVVFLQKNRASPVIYPMVIANYYVLVLFTGAERLKVAIVFLMLAILSRGLVRAALGLAAVLSHGSLIVIYASVIVRQVAAVVLSGRRIVLWQTLISLGAGASVVLFSLSLYGSNFSQKVQSYASFSIESLINTLLISGVSVYMSVNRFATAAMFVPLISAAYIVGSTRITMIAFLVCFYIAVEVRRTQSLPFLCLMLYMSYKSIDFVRSVVLYGNGFNDYAVYIRHGLGQL